MRLRAVGVISFVGLAAVGSARATPPAPHEEARERARPVLMRRCGECHDGARATAKPKALRIFDLREADIAVRMTDAQLDKAIGRMSGSGTEAARDKETVEAWVRAELAKRRDIPADPKKNDIKPQKQN